ncbi:restriction endonuclease subunit S [Vibrio cyclitrophicus]
MSSLQVIPDGYKQTDYGIIPEDWNFKTIGEIASVSSGGTPNRKVPEFWDGDIPWVTTTLINGHAISYANEYITKKGLDLSSAKMCRSGTLLMAMYGQGKTRGKVGVLSFDASINQACAAISLTDSRSNEYVLHVLNSMYEDIRELSNSGGQENLSGGIIKGISMPFPSFEEQTAIANALSDVDALLSELEKLIAKKQAIKTATMQQLLTGKTRLPAFVKYKNGKSSNHIEGNNLQNQAGIAPEGWGRVTLGHDATLKARIGWQALTTKEYLEFGPRLLVTGTDFNAGIVDWNSCCYVSEWRYKQDFNIQLREGDVLVTKDGTIGKVGYVSKLPLEATLNSGVFVIRPKNKKFVPKFLFYVLNSSIFTDFIRAITAGSTITHLYQRDFVNFGFYAPTEEEQTAIATILSNMDEEIQALKQRLSKTRQIKQGMMQELLTGKTRLIQGEAHD